MKNVLLFIRRAHKVLQNVPGQGFGIWNRTYLSLRKIIEDPTSRFVVYGKQIELAEPRICFQFVHFATSTRRMRPTRPHGNQLTCRILEIGLLVHQLGHHLLGAIPLFNPNMALYILPRLFLFTFTMRNYNFWDYINFGKCNFGATGLEFPASVLLVG